jgi:D-lactate dehydrogenase (cytochrome)
VAGGVFLASEEDALRAAGVLREASRRTWRERDPDGVDVRAIELIDGRSLRFLRRRGALREVGLEVPEDAGAAILFEVETARPVAGPAALDLLERVLTGEEVPDGPLARLFRLLEGVAPLERLELAFPDDPERRRRLRRLREAVPETVFETVTEARAHDAEVRKVGGDAIVPFDALGEALPFYHETFDAIGVEHAVWGHVSDGNLHPNAMPRSGEEVRRAEEAQLRIARAVRRWGGCPLSEHGVGRSALKQRMMEEFHGREAVEEMRAVKRAFDPEGRLAPGVLFPVEAR